METRPPTVGRIMVAVGFAISCFGLALFLWVAFGGPLPLGSEGYRFTVPLDEATQLAVESDVRISGVSVGKVKRIDLGDQGVADATIELDSPYAPIPEDTRATLRQKTLLGETYVELSPGDPGNGELPEGGRLAAAQVAPSVQLDEIFRAFDKPTRTAFRNWMQSQAAALHGRGADLSAAIASLDPFSEEANTTLRVLDSQRQAVRRLVADGGEVFAALSERRGQLRGLIDAADRVFGVTARRNGELAEAFRILPTFLRESRATLARLRQFAGDTDPLVRQLRPSARELSPTFISLARLSPDLRKLFDGLGRAEARAASGFPALRSLLRDRLPPLLTRLDPYLARLNPILTVLHDYRHEVTAFLANVAAATQGVVELDANLNELHYIRTEAPLSPEALAAYPRRLRSSRNNPYVRPGGYLNLSSALKSFQSLSCAGGIRAELDPGDAGSFPDDLFARIQQFAFAGETDTDALPQPPCSKQAPYRSIGENPETTDYQHVRRQP